MKPLKIYRSHPAGLKVGNFGDELTELLVTRLFGRSVEAVSMEEAELIGAGSILDTYWRHRQAASRRDRIKQFARNLLRRSPPFLHVWGSGAMLADSKIEWRQQPVYHAVRGKLTADRLGAAAPAALGDPGILAPLLLDKHRSVSAPVALVPHFVDEEHVEGLDLPRHWKVVHTDRDAIETIRAIAASELVISSSLHGLITADAFGIPCIWARSHHDLHKRSDYKFHDHATARGAEFAPARSYLDLAKLTVIDLNKVATIASRELAGWRDSLLGAFPSELRS